MRPATAKYRREGPKKAPLRRPVADREHHLVEGTGATGGRGASGGRLHDPRQRQPDITLARSALGWEPRVPLQEVLVSTIAWFDDLLRKTPQLREPGDAQVVGPRTLQVA